MYAMSPFIYLVLLVLICVNSVYLKVYLPSIYLALRLISANKKVGIIGFDN